ncbi:MAG: hypothetical protein OSB19_13205 [Opitutaceae bacterium]|nr:hypothetical protein [Opitutaceae bacterium]
MKAFKLSASWLKSVSAAVKKKIQMRRKTPVAAKTGFKLARSFQSAIANGFSWIASVAMNIAKT